MMDQERITQYIHSLDQGHGAFCDQIAKTARTGRVPIIRKETANFLQAMVAAKQPKRILEVGTAVGYSALLMAQVMPEETDIITIEKYEPRIPVARRHFEEAGLSDRITLLEGDAGEILKELDGSFDFIFMDAAKGQYIHWLPDILRLLSTGGVLFSDNVLQDGDIINVDCSTILDGYYSDSSRMFCIGNVSPEKKRLVEITRQSIEVGLKEVKPWNFLGDMGAAIHDFVRESGYSVVREIGGHGVGLQFHEEPWVSYVSERGTEMLMVPGMMFTIEPMVNMGKPDVFVDADDDWTVYTEDGKPSAQWEIQVLVTEDGYEIIAY